MEITPKKIMKTLTFRLFYSLVAICLLYACEKSDSETAGSPLIDLQSDLSAASFGDSLSFDIAVSDKQVPLSTVKVQLFYTDELVQETVIRTKENGTYTGKIWIPFLKDVPDAVATIKIVLQNINKTLAQESHEISLSRPDFPYLTLVTEQGEYKMEKTARNQYAVAADFPFSIKGHIKTPKTSAQNSEMTFGYESGAVAFGSTTDIPFSNSSSGLYSITFNTFNFQASPFIIAYAVNGTVMSRIDDNLFYAEPNMTQAEPVVIDGIEDLSDWWIDSDFINKQGQEYTFAAISGKYKITADLQRKYFIIEPMNGNDLATLQPDGSGAIWIIGEGIGKPALTNAVGWTTEKALAMAPIGGKKHQITLVAGETVNASSINFKFFHQKNWGGEYSAQTLTSTSDLIFVGDGSNGRDSGNLGILEGKMLSAGKTYVFTVDLSAGNDSAVLNVLEK